VVETTQVFEGTARIEETHRLPGGDPDSWEETTQSDVARTTLASYEGIAADEYVVGLSSLGDLWGALDDETAELSPRLITRHNAEDSDIWSSLDGQTLWMAEGTEEVSRGGEKLPARRVSVLAVGDVEAGEGLMSNCIQEVSRDYNTDHPGQSDDATLEASLNPGCELGYVHQQVGTEWWTENVLVEAEKSWTEITVIDFGYEWYRDDGDSCERYTSFTKDDDDAELFVEFSKTTITEVLKTPKYEVVTEE